MASCWSWSVRPAAARAPCFASLPGSRRRPPGRFSLTVATSPACRRSTATSRWCFRATRSTRTRACARTWRSGSGSGMSTRRRSTRACGRRPPRSGSRRCSIASRRNSRAASGSAWRWAAPSCASRRRFCSTSRFRISIRILRVSTRAELALLHRRLATTMVYVTHDQEEAMTLGTRVAVMRDGIVEQVAPALEVFRRPANVFVAGFVGSPAMNLWRCSVSSARRRAARRLASLLDRAGRRWMSRLPDGSDVWVGIRPHDIELVPNGDGDGAGRVDIVEPLGPVDGDPPAR